MDFTWTASDDAYRAELRALLDDELPPDWWNSYAYDGPAGPELMQFSRQFNRKLAERDMVVRQWPSEYGGQDADAWSQIIVSEEMWSMGEPRSSLYLGTNWAGPAIMKFGTEEQKSYYLPKIAQGKLLWCQGFSEPEAGTDLASMKTRAERADDGGYIINGSKVWTSYAGRADICFLLARLDGGGKSGVSCFLMPMDTPGLEVRPIAAIHSPHDFNELFLTDVRLPENARVGGEGQGWNVVSTILDYERIGAARYEFSRRVLDRVVELLDCRGLFGRADVSAECAAALSLVEAARLLTYVVIDGRAKEKPATADTNIARYAMIEADHSVANLVSKYLPDLLTHEGDGMLRAHFTVALTAGLAAGAAEVQLNMISGRYLGLPRGHDMDLDFSDDQRAFHDTLAQMVSHHLDQPLTDGIASPVEFYYADVLERDLRDGGFLDVALTEGFGDLEAALLIFEVARSPLVMETVGSALIAPAVLRRSSTGPVAVATLDELTRGVRFLDRATTLIVEVDDGVVAMPMSEFRARTIPSMFAYPLGRLNALPDLASVETLRDITVAEFRRLRRIGLASEIAGAMQAAVDFTVGYVKDRSVFGRPVGSFQAVQHRLAINAERARGAFWLALKAAASGEERDAALAALYAQNAAAGIMYDTHQFNGALGMTLEHKLHFWTFRLRWLQAELGGPTFQSADVAAHHWGAPLGPVRTRE